MNTATVAQMSDDFTLVQNTDEIESILDYIGRLDLVSEVGCMFVQVLDGDYGEIWYCEYTIPYNVYTVYQIQ